MERQMSKRRRVYSLEPNKTAVRTVFASKYVNHLVPALMKINKEIPSDHKNGDCDEFEKIVRYEVDMAMVLSAEEFAWSRALKQKLQTNVNAAGGLIHNSSFCHFTCGEKVGGSTSPLPPASNALTTPMEFSDQNPNCKPKTKKPKRLVLPLRNDIDNAEDHQSEEESRKLKNLRTLLPGGNEMVVDELLTELGSYITCLQLQVNVLQCLAEPH